MPRIRTVKPELAKHEVLFDLEQELGEPVRFAWVMLFTVCDREGRFKWRPRSLKLDVLPYDSTDCARVLDALATRGLLVKYRVGDEWYGCIPTWRRHQVVNNRERASELPSPNEADDIYQQVTHASPTRDSRALSTPMPRHKGKGKERKGKERKGKREGANGRGSRLPTEWEPPETYVAFARERGLSDQSIKDELERFYDHFIAAPGQKGVKLDWFATWRNWIRRAPEFRPNGPKQESLTDRAQRLARSL